MTQVSTVCLHWSFNLATIQEYTVSYSTCRVNFQVHIWKRTYEHSLEIPFPLEHEFYVNFEIIKLEPLWFQGDIILKVLVDFLAEEGTDEDYLVDEIRKNINNDD